MTSWSITSVVVALLIGWALYQVLTRVVYSCPACGSKSDDGHAEGCPWGRRS
jgi:hypothetical protein